MMKKFVILVVAFITLYTLHITQSFAAEKNWSAGGDGSDWADDDNWSPAAAPSSADDVSIDIADGAVTCGQTFYAKSITLGGRETCALASNNFIFGTVAPDSTSDVAILNRSGGTITLTGAGTVTMRGKYQDSEETLDPEPSFLFWIQ